MAQRFGDQYPDFYVGDPRRVQLTFGSHVPPTAYFDTQTLEPLLSGDTGVTNIAGPQPRSVASTSGILTLGLSHGPIHIVPSWNNVEVFTNEFPQGGPPAELLTSPGEVRVTMNIIHLNRSVLSVALSQALGMNGLTTYPFELMNSTTLQPLGNNQPLYSSGNYFVGMMLDILNPLPNHSFDPPYTFPAAVLTGQPMEFPIGSQASIFRLTWRCVPYQYHVRREDGGRSDIISSGTPVITRRNLLDLIPSSDTASLRGG